MRKSTGKPLATLSGHTAPLNMACFSPDGQTLFVNVQHPGEDNFSVWP